MAGRLRTFEKDEALAKALEVFWLKGYSGTSLSDLTVAMGINKPSLYAAFGNKEKLFVSALKQYVDEYGSPHIDKLLDMQYSLKERVQSYLRSITEMVLDSELPGGCFVTTSTCEAENGCLPEEAIKAIHYINQDTRKNLTELFKEELSKAEASLGASPEVLADFLLTVQFGLAVMARDRVAHERLERVIEHAVNCF